MDTPDEQGNTKRAHLRQLEKTSGKTPAALLEQPEPPEAVNHVWTWFWELHSARSSGGMGPITYRDIQAWSEMTRNEPTPWEVQALRAMDRVYMGWAGKKREKDKKKGNQS